MKSLPFLYTLLTSTAIAVAAAFSVQPSNAQTAKNQPPCSYNGGRFIPVKHIDNGGAFTLAWSDGPKMSYIWRGANMDKWNITDTLGGRWHYSDYRDGGSFALTNLDNGNQIRCIKSR
jgi:hypothetical protein